MKVEHEGSKCVGIRASKVFDEAQKSFFSEPINPSRNLKRNLDNQRHLCSNFSKSELKLTNTDNQSPVESRKGPLKSNKKPSFCTNSIRKYFSPKTRSNLRSSQTTQANKPSNEDLMEETIDDRNGVIETEKRTKIRPKKSRKSRKKSRLKS